ncbi:hypothetical protein J2X19_000971 [Rhodoferax ferrireducens]|uniref:Uncharacterized protein n=1 Tax=Rhodoferax ferrireducens TaxID=192843 RepID=A0ABU2C4R7_9BURK|nr:hypothetical protein [Rhodoferax ferrireducens]MDR7376313.1 hypothetical protein [Rhodoferax ferrireducens]
MDFFILAILVAIGIFVLNGQDQRRRIALLGSHLSQYQIEKLMEALTQGYLRALGEKDEERRTQIWNLLSTTETQLCDQFSRFATSFARAPAEETRVSKIAFAIPYIDKLLPQATFDLRQAFAIHAKGMAETVQNTAQRSPKDKAFTMSAELFLMQHTCHWFCKSKVVASARMLARHQTAYAQLLDAVSPATRKAYSSLIES